ncbi:hypothetical protein [Conexibacter woesei]|uniref:hypothetical protein n=1 Tax=Conexibacter woesei TaxID=191495 RepID=UPI0003FFD52A|nr:hypothetical protein [Conexibacter woesei]
MTRRDELARLALLAFPAGTRALHGEEMAGALRDATAGAPRRRVAAELLGLVHAGLGLRAGQAARRAPERLVADGVCSAGVWILTLDLATLLGQHVRGEHDALLAWWSIAALALTLAVALVGFDRLAGAVALAWTASRVPALHGDGIATGELLTTAVLPVLVFTTMVVRPRRRATDPRRLAWLAIPLALAAILGPPPWEHDAVLVALVAVLAVAVAISALAAVGSDPRLALAGTITLTSIIARDAAHPAALTPPAILLLAATPALLTITALRARTLRREGTQLL